LPGERGGEEEDGGEETDVHFEEDMREAGELKVYCTGM